MSTITQASNSDAHLHDSSKKICLKVADSHFFYMCNHFFSQSAMVGFGWGTGVDCSQDAERAFFKRSSDLGTGSSSTKTHSSLSSLDSRLQLIMLLFCPPALDCVGLEDWAILR